MQNTDEVKVEVKQLGEAPILLKDCSDDRAKWLELRKGKLSGSTICTAAGMNRYQSPLELWAEMTGRIEPKEETDQMAWGTLLQDDIGEFFKRKTGIDCIPLDMLLGSKDLPWAVVTPDFMIVEGGQNREDFGLGEGKTSGFWARKDWEGGKVPDAAAMQLQWALGLTKLDYGYVIGVLGNSSRDFHQVRLERDPEVFDNMVALGERFLKLVKEDTPPETQAGDSGVLDRMFAPTDAEIELPEKALALFRAYDDCKATLKNAEASAKDLKSSLEVIENELRLLLGDAKSGSCGDRLAFYKPWTRKGYTVEPKEGVYFKIK